MYKYLGEVTVSDPKRIIKKLCNHFERKVKVAYDKTEGKEKNTVHFPLGLCDIYNVNSEIKMEIYNWEEKLENGKNGLAIIKYILDEHINQFNYKEAVEIKWDTIKN